MSMAMVERLRLSTWTVGPMSDGMAAVFATLSGQVESGDAMTVTHGEPQAAGAYVSGGHIRVCLNTCWSCKADHHHTPPTWHTWADADDIWGAAQMGRPDPSTSRCGCPCADPDAPQPDWGDDEPDLDDYGPDGGVESYTQEPCPVCEATGACGWDVEGRPLIHAMEGGSDD